MKRLLLLLLFLTCKIALPAQLITYWLPEFDLSKYPEIKKEVYQFLNQSIKERNEQIAGTSNYYYLSITGGIECRIMMLYWYDSNIFREIWPIDKWFGDYTGFIKINKNIILVSADPEYECFTLGKKHKFSYTPKIPQKIIKINWIFITDSKGQSSYEYDEIIVDEKLKKALQYYRGAPFKPLK